MSRKFILCCLAEIIAIIAVACVAEATSTISSGATAAAPGATAIVAEATTDSSDHVQIPDQAQQPVPGCETEPIDLYQYGGAEFASPPVVSSVDGALNTTLIVTFTDNTQTYIGPCPVTLRSYNGQLVGPTLRVKPGDTIQIQLENQLPDDSSTDHDMMNTLHNFNTTNLHTHGLHVSPEGNSDNVLLEIGPGEDWYVEVKVPPDHPAGTFWYHPHVHGSTATQVSSGMAGALIIEGGLDDVPEIAQASEQVFVIQQVPYSTTGELDLANAASITFGPCTWEALQRSYTINGQLFPTISMAPGEVQRWRMIHAGVRESIGVELRGPGAVGLTITDALNLPIQNLNEIAVDGLALGAIDVWRQVELEPGYRSDVLVQVEDPGTYYLIDNGVEVMFDGAPIPSNALTCSTDYENPSFLARVMVTGTVVTTMTLPSATELTDLAPFRDTPLVTFNPNPTNAEDVITPTVPIDGFQLVDFTVAQHPSNVGPVLFNAADHPFDPANPRRLKLGNVEEWVLTTRADSLYYAHPFHIHVNPFQTWRYGPEGEPELVWKDTLLIVQGQTYYLYTHYTDYIGQFVYHCHILDHEDQGMMELLEIDP